MSIGVYVEPCPKWARAVTFGGGIQMMNGGRAGSGSS
jgi:hypothetical protein